MNVNIDRVERKTLCFACLIISIFVRYANKSVKYGITVGYRNCSAGGTASGVLTRVPRRLVGSTGSTQRRADRSGEHWSAV